MAGEFENMESQRIRNYQSRIEYAQGFNDIWKVVKDTVRDSLGEHRSSMLLFLDDLPLQLGAYYPVGTNNIVLNRALVTVVENATKDRNLVNAFVYSILTHEYLHAIGHMSEPEVRSLVRKVSRDCFGDNHAVTKLAEESPWSLLKDVPLGRIEVQSYGMEVVKDFEDSSQKYII